MPLGSQPRKTPSIHNLEERLRGARQAAEEIQEALVTTSTSLTSSQYQAHQAIDLQLQEVILETLGNTLLGKVLCLVASHSLRIRSFAEASTGSSKGEVLHDTNREHLAIIKALLDKDSERTQEAVKRHLDNREGRALRAMRRLETISAQGGDKA